MLLDFESTLIIIYRKSGKKKAGPQNRRFASATCTRVSNALHRSKYLQQDWKYDSEDEKCTTKCAFLEKNSKFGITSFRKVGRERNDLAQRVTKSLTRERRTLFE